MMARQMILPAALRYQEQVASAIDAAQNVGAEVNSQLGLLKELTETISGFQQTLTDLDKAAGNQPHADALKHAIYMRDTVLHLMNHLRRYGDLLEKLVADDQWPLPTYREMLFMR